MDRRGVQQPVEEGPDYSAECPLQERSHSMLHASVRRMCVEK